MILAQHRGLIGMLGDENGIEGTLGLGELAELSVSNEGDSPINDVSIYLITSVLRQIILNYVVHVILVQKLLNIIVT
jgi:hypothetical protein